MSGVPLQKISVTSLVVVLAFLVAGTVLIITGHADQGMQAMATATGVVVGTVATTTVVVRSNGKGNGNTPQDPPFTS